MSAAVGAVLFLLAALLPIPAPRTTTVRRALGAAGVLALLPVAGGSGSWPFVLLGAAAAALGTPLALGLAAAGAMVAGLHPEAVAPLTAAVAGLGVAAAADAVAATLDVQRRDSDAGSIPVLVAAVLFVLVLVLIDQRSLLSWSFGLGTGDARVVFPDVGRVLGGALATAAGGTLLLAAGVAAPAAGARQAGRAVLGASVVVAGGGLALAYARCLSLDEALRAAATRPLGAVAATGVVLAVLLIPRKEEERPEGSRAALGTRVAAGLAVAAAVAAGAESWWRAGSSVADITAAAVATALLGLAALEGEARLLGTRRALLLGALLVLTLV